MEKRKSLSEYLKESLGLTEPEELLESMTRTRVRSHFKKVTARDSLAQRVQDLKYVSSLSPRERSYLE
jgi:hypothetical protein